MILHTTVQVSLVGQTAPREERKGRVSVREGSHFPSSKLIALLISLYSIIMQHKPPPPMKNFKVKKGAGLRNPVVMCVVISSCSQSGG